MNIKNSIRLSMVVVVVLLLGGSLQARPVDAGDQFGVYNTTDEKFIVRYTLYDGIRGRKMELRPPKYVFTTSPAGARNYVGGDKASIRVEHIAKQASFASKMRAHAAAEKRAIELDAGRSVQSNQGSTSLTQLERPLVQYFDVKLHGNGGLTEGEIWVGSSMRKIRFHTYREENIWYLLIIL